MIKKTFLFDLDGVLVDTKKIHAEALIAATNFVGINITSKFHSEYLEGLPTIKKIQKIEEHYKINLSNEAKEKIFEMKQFLSNSRIEHYENVNLGLKDCFELLKSCKVNIGICSNTRRRTLDILVQRIGLTDFIDLALSGEDVVEPKPSPEIFDKAVHFFKATKSETYIFEDSEVGLKAAYATGCHVIHIAHPSDLTKELLLPLVGKK